MIVGCPLAWKKRFKVFADLDEMTAAPSIQHTYGEKQTKTKQNMGMPECHATAKLLRYDLIFLTVQ